MVKSFGYDRHYQPPCQRWNRAEASPYRQGHLPPGQLILLTPARSSSWAPRAVKLDPRDPRSHLRAVTGTSTTVVRQRHIDGAVRVRRFRAACLVTRPQRPGWPGGSPRSFTGRTWSRVPSIAECRVIGSSHAFGRSSVTACWPGAACCVRQKCSPINNCSSREWNRHRHRAEDRDLRLSTFRDIGFRVMPPTRRHRCALQ